MFGIPLLHVKSYPKAQQPLVRSVTSNTANKVVWNSDRVTFQFALLCCTVSGGGMMLTIDLERIMFIHGFIPAM